MTTDDIFYDFGAGKGNSMGRAVQWWGGRGVGFEDSGPRRAIAVERGYNVQPGRMPDCMAALPPDGARYSVINHVLEHIPEMRIARKIIQEALRVSREFVYLAGPWMESDLELMLAGCKWFCNDWPKDHPTRVTALDIYSAARDSKQAKHIAVYGRDRIGDTGHDHVYPLESAPLPTPYLCDDKMLASKGDPKPLHLCYSEICCLIFKDAKCDETVLSQFEEHNPTAEPVASIEVK